MSPPRVKTLCFRQGVLTMKQLEMHLEAYMDNAWHHMEFARVMNFTLFAFVNGEDIGCLRDGTDIEPACVLDTTFLNTEFSKTTNLYMEHKKLKGHKGVLSPEAITAMHEEMAEFGELHLCEDWMRGMHMDKYFDMLTPVPGSETEVRFEDGLLQNPKSFRIVWQYTE